MKTDRKTDTHSNPSEGSIETASIRVPRIGEPNRRREALQRAVKYIVNEAFQHSPLAAGYYVSQTLSELFPDKILIETCDWEFDPVKFASAGNCSLVVEPIPHPQSRLVWSEGNTALGKLSKRLWQGWLVIQWEGLALEVLMLHFEGRHSIRHAFILADTNEDATRFLQSVCRWNIKPRDELLVYDGDEWKKDADLHRAISQVRFESLILRPGLRDEIVNDASTFFDSRAMYERHAAPWKRGLLFVGPPGNGKTHAAKALVNHLDKPCLYVKSFRGYSGPDDYAIADVFRMARKASPCMLVFEDLDALITKRNRSFFLNEVDGFAGNTGLLMVATTNHVERLDPAIADRPGRFDRKFTFELPRVNERRAFIETWNQRTEPAIQAPPHLLDEVASLTEGFSFAYLKELCLSTLIATLNAGAEIDFGTQMKRQLPKLREQLVVKRKKQKADRVGEEDRRD